MWRDALLVAGKDLRIESRSRVAMTQVAPFALIVLVMFAFALDPDTGVLKSAAAGLFWVAVLFSAILGIQRSFSIEAADSARDSLRLSGLDPAGIFLGKASALVVQLLALEVILGAGVLILYGPKLGSLWVLVVTAVVATVGLASAGTVYGVLAAGIRVRETLLPLLLLPVVAPVVLAATKSWGSALGVDPGGGHPWLRLLGVFAVIYTAFGVVAFGPLLEES